MAASRSEVGGQERPQAVLDTVGEETLELFRENDGYSEFLWDALFGLSSLSGRPLEGRVLEVGCGIGNLTQILLRSDAVTFLHAIGQTGPARFVPGIEGNRTSVTREGFLRPPQLLQRGTKVVMRIGHIGLDGEGPVKACHGLIQFSKVTKREPKVAVRIRVIGPHDQYPHDEIDSNVVFPHLMGDHTKHMQGAIMTGVGPQNSLINALGHRQATRHVVLQGQVHGLTGVRGINRRGLSTGGCKTSALLV